MAKTSKDAGRYMSGFCGNGAHEAPGGEFIEGQRPKQACKGWHEYSAAGVVKKVFCGCDCHAVITEMYKSSGIDRIWPDADWRSAADRFAFSDAQPKFDLSFLTDWKAPFHPEPLPENAADLAPSLEAIESGDDERKISDILPPNPSKPEGWAPKTSPRPAGALEWEVKLACDQWILGAYSSVKQLKALDIARIVGGSRPPSTGAITNILIQWESIGFAKVQLDAPRHFIGYTEAGISLGIEKLRERKAAEGGAARRVATSNMRTGNFGRR